MLSCLSQEGRIPWNNIAEYAVVMGLAKTPSEIGSFVVLIREMEKSYGEFRRAEQEKAQKNAKKPKGVKGRHGDS